MKKTFYYFLFLAGTSSLYAQSLVGTTVEQKKPLLEKFTGVNCGYCPEGAVIIEELIEEYGDNITVFAHHTFGQDMNTYEIAYSDSIAEGSKATGYPAGNVNRFEYTNWQQNPGGTAMGRGSWESAVELEASKDAYVNIGTQFRYDDINNKFYVDVELYYTGDPVGDQMLNVGIVQSHVRGPQAGSDEGDNNNYEHNHMLRDLFTGQWGELLTDAANGELITWSHEFTVPSSYGAVTVVPEDMEIVAFVTEGHVNVANSSHAKPLPYLHHALNPSIEDRDVSICGDTIAPFINLTNFGTSDLTDVEITYAVNGVEYIYNWSGSLESYETEEVELPAISFASSAINTFSAEVTNTNNVGADDDADNNLIEYEFSSSQQINANSHLKLKLDGYGNEITWRVVDDEGVEHYTGGPYDEGIIDLIDESFNLTDDRCYTFEIKDSGNNGLEGGQDSDGTYYPPGYFKFMSGSYTLQETSFGNRKSQFFTINTATIGTSEIELNKIKIFPNPSSQSFEIELGVHAVRDITYSLTDVLGKIVVIHTVEGGTQGDKNGIMVDHDLPPGIYNLRVTYDGISQVAKLIIQ